MGAESGAMTTHTAISNERYKRLVAAEKEQHLMRDTLARIVGAFTSGIYCANCGEGVELCRCVIDLGRTALRATSQETR